MTGMTDLLVTLVWNVTALVSLAFALIGTGGALADWEYLRFKRINGVNSIQVGANLRNQLTRMLVSLLFLLIGALALVDAPYRGEASRWLLIAASIMLATGSVCDWLDRRRALEAIIDEQEPPT